MLGFEGLLLALFRFLAFFMTFPLMNTRGVPMRVKIGLAALTALIVNPECPVVFDSNWLWISLIIQEIIVGLVLGFVVSIVFAIIYFAGQLIDVPIGFGMASIFDPATGAQMPVFSQFYYLLALAFFLAVDGHLWVLGALAKSYTYLPINSFFAMDVGLEVLVVLTKQIFLIGLQIAAPIMGTILLLDVVLGVITRTIPQLNVFILGFPLKILLGLSIIMLAIPAFLALAATLFGRDGLLLEALIGMLKSGS